MTQPNSEQVASLNQQAQRLSTLDFDTQEHEDTFNEFCALAGSLMTPEQHDQWDAWSLKATSQEIVTEALRILGLDRR